MNIIFLDIDGVLNGYNKWTYRIIKITKFLHLPIKIVRDYLDIFGIKEIYVRRLSKIVHKTNSKIVMSSSWRIGYWTTPYDELYKDQKKLYDLLINNTNLVRPTQFNYFISMFVNLSIYYILAV